VNYRIFLSGPIIRYVEYQKEIELTAHSPQEALSVLVKTYPQLEPVLFREGTWNESIRIYMNDVCCTFEQMVSEDDSCHIYLVVPIVGG
jgi:hypothetical protein